MQRQGSLRNIAGLGTLLLAAGLTQTAHGADAFNTVTAQFSCADDEAAVQASGAAGLTAGGVTYYIGTHQADAANQNPVVAAFGAQNWCRADYETIGADGRGEGLLFDQGRLYAAFSIDGADNPADADLRRFTGNGWIDSYGSGGSARVSVILRLDPATGNAWAQDNQYQGSYVLARLSNGNTNGLTVQSMALDAAGNLELAAEAFSAPLSVNGQLLELPAGAESPFAYSLRLSPDLSTALAASVEAACPEPEPEPVEPPPNTGTPGVFSSAVGVPALGPWGLGLLTGLLGLLGMGLRRRGA